MDNADAIPRAALDRIRGLYSQPPRAYHNWDHIQACLAELKGARRLCDDFPALRWAILFHDAVYDVHRHDNEENSAELACQWLKDWHQPAALCGEVQRLILATRHVAIPAWKDGQIMVDIDLAILGRPADLFDAYELAIRREYGFVAEAAFRQGRAGVLQRFLARPRIYLTEFFHGRYESQARRNLARSLQQLG